MDTAPASSWQPNETEVAAAGQLLGHLGTRFPLTTSDRVCEIAATVAYARQILIQHGPAIATPGADNLGSLIVSTLDTGRLRELEIFNGLHTRASEAELLAERPTLMADLEAAERALGELTEALKTISPPLAVNYQTGAQKPSGHAT